MTVTARRKQGKSSPDKDRSLSDLYSKFRACSVFKDLREGHRYTKPTGNPDPLIVFVGSFTTVSFPFLVEALDQVNLTPEDCFFTDLFKYDAISRKPYPNEIDRALAFLEDEIAILQPKVVVPMGQDMLEAFIEEETITHLHGQPYDWETHWLVPIMHPRHCILGGEEAEDELLGDMITINQYRKKKPSKGWK